MECSDVIDGSNGISGSNSDDSGSNSDDSGSKSGDDGSVDGSISSDDNLDASSLDPQSGYSVNQCLIRLFMSLMQIICLRKNLLVLVSHVLSRSIGDYVVIYDVGSKDLFMRDKELAIDWYIFSASFLCFSGSFSNF